MTANPPGPRITERFTACGICLETCPVQAISEGTIYRIDSMHCLECDRCVEICPMEAIDPVEGV